MEIGKNKKKDIGENKKDEQERPAPMEPQKEPGGLHCSEGNMEALNELRWHTQHEQNVITGASDRSV